MRPVRKPVRAHGGGGRKGREGSVRVGLGRIPKRLSGDGTSEGDTMHTKRVRGWW